MALQYHRIVGKVSHNFGSYHFHSEEEVVLAIYFQYDALATIACYQNERKLPSSLGRTTFIATMELKLLSLYMKSHEAKRRKLAICIQHIETMNGDMAASAATTTLELGFSGPLFIISQLFDKVIQREH